ncbi:MAG: PAS domain S-box protein [Cryobacterium sp.]|nr:PAS domain S-box protein [Oligoflexia bacterium]
MESTPPEIVNRREGDGWSQSLPFEYRSIRWRVEAVPLPSEVAELSNPLAGLGLFAGLAEALEWQSAILNGGEISVVSTDNEGLVTFMNAAAERLLGYSKEEIEGHYTPLKRHDGEQVARRTEVLEKTGRP